MDQNKLNLLLNNEMDNVENYNDSDLENELEMILSGNQPKRQQKQQPKSTAPQSQPAPVAKQHQANVSKGSDVYKNVPDKKKKLAPGAEPVFDLSEVEKILSFDPNKLTDLDDNDDDDADLEDENMLSELNTIVNSSPREEFSHEELVAPQPRRSAPPAPFAQVEQPPPLPARAPQQRSSIPNVPTTPLVRPNTQPPLNALSQKIEHVKKLQVENKRLALKCKSEGNIEKAKSYLLASKQLDSVLVELSQGKDVDLDALGNNSSASVAKPVAGNAEVTEITEHQIDRDDAKKLFKVDLNEPRTPLEALTQRLDKFKATEKEAKEQGNSSKARRINRIVKKYELAIKDVKQGKPVNYEELDQMCPPGYPPIPTTTNAKPAAAAVPPPPVPKPQPVAPSNVAGPSKPAPRVKPSLKRGMSTVATKQLEYLQEQQSLFRKAAIEAKRRGELDQAKEYLRSAKGFDPLIDATINGLPIDATSIPVPPQLKQNDDFVILDDPVAGSTGEMAATSNEELSDEQRELFEKVEKELLNQVEMCIRNKEYFQKLGDIATAQKFEKYSLEGKKDLNMIRVRYRNHDSIPSYKIETRTFSIVIVNTDVAVNELQVEIVKAYELSVGKSDLDTYVRVEFPFPTEKVQSKRTKTVHNTLEPNFEEVLKFDIDRKARSLLRVLKRHSIKVELFSKGGFFRSDSLLGTAIIKVSDLETKCTIHDTYPLVEGKKNNNGRVEVKVKIREPFLSKQIEEIKEKWIVFG